MKDDQKTADSFASSWNNLPTKSIYTEEQVTEWFAPLIKNDFENKEILELGCGNGSLLSHIVTWGAKKITGVDLGESVESAKMIISKLKSEKKISEVEIIKDDLTTFVNKPYDIVYSIGVLHHLKNPHAGFLSVLKNTKSGGKFHCWVYAYEGNAIIRHVVDPIRILASKLPWWFTKYFVATPLVIPYFIYANIISLFDMIFGNIAKSFLGWLPLYEYSLWISKRGFLFFRHVAFDQLVTPQTIYLKKEILLDWLKNADILENTSYTIFRNGNSWKFGGVKK